MPKPKLYTAFGESKKWGAWVKDDRCVVDSEALRSRLRYDWDFERALTEPPETDRRKMLTAYGETKSIREWVDDPRNVSKASYTTLQARLNSLGMEIEEALEFEGRDFQTYEAFGESKGWGDWLKDARVDVPARTIRTRLASGLSFEKSITLNYIQPKLYTVFGENKTAAEWFKDSRCVASYDLLNNRLSRGWDAKAAITTPSIEPIRINGQTLSELEESTGLPVRSRLRRGVPPEEAIHLPKIEPKLYKAFNEEKTLRDWSADSRCVVSLNALTGRFYAGWSLEDSMTVDPISAHVFSAFGESKTIIEWAEDSRCKVSVGTLRRRLGLVGSDSLIEEAISTPQPPPSELDAFGEKKTFTEWSKDPRCIVEGKLLYSRVSKGWEPVEAMATPVILPSKLDAFGDSMTASEWENDGRCKVSSGRISTRLSRGWSIEDAISTPKAEVKLYSAFGEDKSLSDWSKETGILYATLHSRIHKSNISIEEALTAEVGESASLKEKQLADWLSDYIEIERNNRTIISPKELDIYIPSKSVAIEFNGLYWHSEKFCEPDYHYEKFLSCRDAGVRLIQVWEDEWDTRSEVVKSMLLHKLGLSESEKVFARKTKVVELSHGDAVEFMNQNHIQGGTSLGSVRLGLTHEGKTVACMCFKSCPESAKEDWELTRYATSLNVVGGSSKLMSYFSKTHSGIVKTFADLCISDGGLYDETGWVKDDFIPPDYRYMYDRGRSHKFLFRKERFERDPDLIFHEDLTERELAAVNGLLRIYDAGKQKFTYQL